MDPSGEGGEIARLDDRRSARRPARTLVLYPDRIEVHRAHGHGAEFVAPLSAISRVAVGLEAGGAAGQAVCRVTVPRREIVFGSMRAERPAFAVDNGEAFRRFVVALHEALRPRFEEVEFVRRQSRAVRNATFAVGLALAAVAFVLVVLFQVRGDGLALVLGTVPFVLIGGALAIAFRPGGAAHYDPDVLIAEFSDPVTVAPGEGGGGERPAPPP